MIEPNNQFIIKLNKALTTTVAAAQFVMFENRNIALKIKSLCIDSIA
ncbi:hypothetical protein THOE12_100172 [Vibrio rotiferianus]|nr:hypothetical protein THOE12_100172 [Vibrio rotiferianus]